MLVPGRVAGMGRVPPGVREAGRDCEGNNKRKPAARSIKESFSFDFPPSQNQTDQTENGSDRHTSNDKAKSWSRARMT